MTGYILCPYKRSTRIERLRYCAMDDFTRQIRAEGGNWVESEVAGDQAIVKVRASAALLTVIANTPGFTIPTRQEMDTLIAAGRNTPRWDRLTETIVLDGALVSCKPLAELDRQVTANGAIAPARVR